MRTSEILTSVALLDAYRSVSPDATYNEKPKFARHQLTRNLGYGHKGWVDRKMEKAAIALFTEWLGLLVRKNVYVRIKPISNPDEVSLDWF